MELGALVPELRRLQGYEEYGVAGRETKKRVIPTGPEVDSEETDTLGKAMIYIAVGKLDPMGQIWPISCFCK